MENTSAKYKAIIWAAVIIVILVGWKLVRYSGTRPDSNLYQVVLLSNDQAFYGKLHNVYSQFPYLTDIYYLNPQQQAVDKTGNPIGGRKFTVIKRGIDEIHMPTDRLYISAKNMLYWENVGADSLVAKGIAADKEYRAKQAAAPSRSEAPL